VKVALLVIDMQKEFFNDKESRESLYLTLDYVNYSIDKFREANQPIVFILDEDAGGGIGSEGYKLFEYLKYEEQDIYISKRYGNAFWKTGLEDKLKELEVDFVVICGFSAEYCIYSTYNGALERGFEVSLLQHGIASIKNEYINFIEDICRTTSIKTIEYFLKKM
jgi:nicotinamidase-related amidase